MDSVANAELNHPDPFVTFVATGLLVSDVVLKDMLWSLHSSLQSNMQACLQRFMQACLQRFSAEIQNLGDRVTHLEDGVSACNTSFNTMVDAND